MVLQWANIPGCCEEDDVCIKVSTVSPETSDRLQRFSHSVSKYLLPGARLYSSYMIFSRVDSLGVVVRDVTFQPKPG